MKLIDFVKAAALAALVLLIDVLIAIAVVLAWSDFVVPGHTSAYYQTAGIPIALWSTRLVGTALIFGASWLFAKRRPQRNPWLFAVSLTVFYALSDGASVNFVDFFTLSMALTMALKLIGALAGAYVAVRRAKGARPDLPQ